jgi:EAL domain-containing protein (putative c-di-GMP-specific phosphodiesterase class I)
MAHDPLGVPIAKRDSRGLLLTPAGRLFLWCPTPQAQAKIQNTLTASGIEARLAEGDCLIVDLPWETMRGLVIPMRRILTHREAEELRVLYKPAGGELTTADFPKVQSYSQFSLLSQSSWLGELLADERLTAVLQPIVHADNPQRVYGHEALLRGIGRDRSIVYPNYIFDVARGCGMMMQLDLAARQAAIDRMVIDDIRETLFVNLMPSAIDDPVSSLHRTVEMIDEARIPHERVVFEVVESEQAHGIVDLRSLLRGYREAGFRVALDDIGSGYSSLNLLHQLRPDFVKLDMELIRGVHADPYKALIAQKMIEIANTLGVETIAEGVETMEELRWVGASGATYAQGNAIGRPSVPTLQGRTPTAPRGIVS